MKLFEVVTGEYSLIALFLNFGNDIPFHHVTKYIFCTIKSRTVVACLG